MEWDGCWQVRKRGVAASGGGVPGGGGQRHVRFPHDVPAGRLPPARRGPHQGAAAGTCE